MAGKCVHGSLWSSCFEEAKARDCFSRECIANIREEIFFWFKKRNHVEAEDLIQEFCLKLVNSYRSYSKDRDKSQTKDGRAYVYAIARNVYISYCRKLKLCPQVKRGDIEESADRHGDPSLEVMEKEEVEVVNTCLDNLPAEQRLVIIHLKEDLPQQKIAEMLGISPKTVYNRNEKALENLVKCLKRHGIPVQLRKEGGRTIVEIKPR